MYANKPPNPGDNLEAIGIPSDKWGPYISECINYVKECGCESPYEPSEYDNMCIIREDDCYPKCKCKDPNGEFYQVLFLLIFCIFNMCF